MRKEVGEGRWRGRKRDEKEGRWGKREREKG